MDLKSELKKVEKKLLDKREKIELDVIKAFNSYAMHEWSYDSSDCFLSDINDLRDEYTQLIATLNAIQTIIDWKEVE